MSSQDIMRRQGKTFFWATQFLPKNEAKDIAILYTFCRFVDDLVDIKGESCEKIYADILRNASQFSEVQELLVMASERQMSLEPIKILVKTLETDQKGKRIETWGELLRYCYGVASTIGLMMCDIFGVKNKVGQHFAVDLGIAMQLTNIARDITEDAFQNRIYLPQEAFIEGISEKTILDGLRQRELLKVQGQILNLADRYYKSADLGMHFLPRPARLAIIIASRLYQAKGITIRRDPAFYLKNRADVSLCGKIYHTMRAIRAFCFTSSYLSEKGISHDASLHRELMYLPAINQS